MDFLDLYYNIKPIIPRSFQLFIRRKIAFSQRRRNQAVWPIDREAAQHPPGWKGWPDNKKFAFVLMHDVDTEKGYDRCDKLLDIDKQMGFRSAFFFVPEGYHVSRLKRQIIIDSSFEIGVHGLLHDGKIFKSRKVFDERSPRINRYLREWETVGFSSPSMIANLDWITELNIEYDVSTYDTDPFEPQPMGIRSIFPFWHTNPSKSRGNIGLPYTLPQDHTLFIILKEPDIKIWKEKLDWIAERGGMVLLNTHPDYMDFSCVKCSSREYPVARYISFLEYLKTTYEGQYWHCLPRDMARFWRTRTAESNAIIAKAN